MKVKKIIGHGFSVIHSMDMPKFTYW